MSTPDPGPALAVTEPLPESVKAAHRQKLAKATAKQAGAQTKPDPSATLSTAVEKSSPMDKSQPTFSGKVHPVAALFPMMPDPELDELAADIKANGLLNPIVLDENGILIDGRNRQEACKRAKIKPTYAALNGADPVAFIFSSNHKRRHITKGQKAMIAAKARKDLGRSKKSSDSEDFMTIEEMAILTGVAQGALGSACIIMEFAKDQIDLVISGGVAFETAYSKAQERKKAAATHEAKMERLRKEAPDLADQVTEEKLTLAEAIGALNAREAEEKKRAEAKRQEREIATNQLQKILLFAGPNGKPAKEKALSWIALIDPEFIQDEIRAEDIEQCGEVLNQLAEAWAKSYGQIQSKS